MEIARAGTPACEAFFANELALVSGGASTAPVQPDDLQIRGDGHQAGPSPLAQEIWARALALSREASEVSEPVMTRAEALLEQARLRVAALTWNDVLSIGIAMGPRWWIASETPLAYAAWRRRASNSVGSGKAGYPVPEFAVEPVSPPTHDVAPLASEPFALRLTPTWGWPIAERRAYALELIDWARSELAIAYFNAHAETMARNPGQTLQLADLATRHPTGSDRLSQRDRILSTAARLAPASVPGRKLAQLIREVSDPILRDQLAYEAGTDFARNQNAQVADQMALLQAASKTRSRVMIVRVALRTLADQISVAQAKGLIDAVDSEPDRISVGAATKRAFWWVYIGAREKSLPQAELRWIGASLQKGGPNLDLCERLFRRPGALGATLDDAFYFASLFPGRDGVDLLELYVSRQAPRLDRAELGGRLVRKSAPAFSDSEKKRVLGAFDTGLARTRDAQ
jgi:hypothetical protein